MSLPAPLARSPLTAEYLLKNLSADRLVQLLKCLLLDRFPDFEKDINDLLATITAKRQERNEVLHWLWGKADAPDTAVMTTIRPFRDERVKHKTARELRELAQEMLNAVVALTVYLHHASSPEEPELPLPSLHSPLPSKGDLKDSLGLLGRPQMPSQE
jgi:hypothetical protein